MDIKQLYREETELDVYTVALMEQRVEHFSENYVKWLEAKINYTQCCEKLQTIKELKNFTFEMNSKENEDKLWELIQRL